MQITRKKPSSNSNINRSATLFLLCVLQLQCSAFKGYLLNRGYDLRDIVNIGFEEHVYGGGIYIDSVILGLSYNVDGNGYGIRFGHFGNYKTGNSNQIDILLTGTKQKPCKNKIGLKFANFGDNLLPYFASNYHRIGSHELIRNEKKMIVYATVWLTSKQAVQQHVRMCYKNIEASTFIRDSYVVLPMEVSLGLHYGIRLGFNPHELLDFLVGIFGFDLLDDDTTMVYSELPRSVERNQSWEKDFEEVDMEMGMRITREREEQEKIKGFK